MSVDPKACPVRENDVGARPVFPFEEFRTSGVLWLVNRVVFHPRGFALAWEHVEGVDEPIGWSVQGDGSEPWVFFDEGGMEDERFQLVEALLQEARDFGSAPSGDTK